MRHSARLLAIVTAISVPVALTFWSTSSFGQPGAGQAAAPQALSPREVVERFEQLAFDEGKPAEAVRRYFSRDVVDHSPRIAGDFDSIIELLDRLDWSKGGPKRTIHHIVAEGDMVMVHHHLVREPNTPGFSAVDMFRVENGKIVEHWEALQELPEDSPNKFGPF